MKLVVGLGPTSLTVRLFSIMRGISRAQALLIHTRLTERLSMGPLLFMKVIVGLGNPGEKYKNNRHNVGHMVLDAIASSMANSKWQMEKKFEADIFDVSHSLQATSQKLLLAKPKTFMNDSGRAVKKLVDFYKIHTNELYVVYDDLDIPLGKYKIQKGKGPRQHKGVGSVEQALGTKDFWHVRVGIENRKVDESREGRKSRKSGEEYVLEDFTAGEQEVIAGVIEQVAARLKIRSTKHEIRNKFK